MQIQETLPHSHSPTLPCFDHTHTKSLPQPRDLPELLSTTATFLSWTLCHHPVSCGFQLHIQASQFIPSQDLIYLQSIPCFSQRFSLCILLATLSVKHQYVLVLSLYLPQLRASLSHRRELPLPSGGSILSTDSFLCS